MSAVIIQGYRSAAFITQGYAPTINPAVPTARAYAAWQSSRTGQAAWQSSKTGQAAWSAFMAVNVNLEVFRGQAKVYTFPAARVPQNIAGWNLALNVRSSAFVPGSNPPTSPLFQLTTGAGLVITDSVNGTITGTFTSAQTTLTPGTYYYDLWRTDVGQEDDLAYGTFTVHPAYWLN